MKQLSGQRLLNAGQRYRTDEHGLWGADEAYQVLINIASLPDLIRVPFTRQPRNPLPLIP
jgi:hypothetical protein